MSIIILKINNLYGTLNTEGEMLIEPSLDAIKGLANGFLAVSKKGKWGCIDASGDLIIDFIHKNVEEVDLLVKESITGK